LKVVIITEGGESIGFGHITRCSSIYEALELRNISPLFIVKGDQSIENLLVNKNHIIFDWINDTEFLYKKIENSDLVIIDSYLASVEIYQKISELAAKSLFLDDNLRIKYPAGIVLNGCIFAEDLPYPVNQKKSYLLGSRYIPLRKVFWDVQKKLLKENIESIMITFGGDDFTNTTPKILSLLKIKFSHLKKKVIIGRSFKNSNEIEKFIDQNTELILYPKADEMKQIMLESCIAISAAGQTLYELARIGVPVIAVGVADNQENNIKGWQKADFIEFGGWCNDTDLLNNIEKCINKLDDISYRKNKSLTGKNFVDGHGSPRIVQELLGK
jgi:UDP-2,4-diacetamido-2,4,6-trideoxy-beta-L-altropyranose hydrolase